MRPLPRADIVRSGKAVVTGSPRRAPRKGIGVVTMSAPACPPAARKRRRCVLRALKNIEQCLWEHLYTGGDPEATLRLLRAMETRLGHLEVEMQGAGLRRARATG